MKEELKQNQENWFNHNVLAWIECDICADGIFCKKKWAKTRKPKCENYCDRQYCAENGNGYDWIMAWKKLNKINDTYRRFIANICKLWLFPFSLCESGIPHFVFGLIIYNFWSLNDWRCFFFACVFFISPIVIVLIMFVFRHFISVFIMIRTECIGIARLEIDR